MLQHGLTECYKIRRKRQKLPVAHLGLSDGRDVNAVNDLSKCLTATSRKCPPLGWIGCPQQVRDKAVDRVVPV